MMEAPAVQQLSQGWKVQDFAFREGLAARVHLPEYADAQWLDIPVPGDVHRVLMSAGRIADPFYDQNENACAWMEEREWWYRLAFDAPPDAASTDERLLLVFEGLDTFATVYLDGEEIGEHHNMLRTATFDVTPRLRAGESHVLAIRFDPPMQRIVGKTLSAWGRNPERTAMRKAQFGYGWDWGPRLPTIGIWRPVELKRQRQRPQLGGVARQFPEALWRAAAARAHARKRLVPALRRGHGSLHLGVRDARGSRGRNTPPRDPRGSALPPQSGDGLAQQGQPQEQG
jgi:beta-galactosidase/beta-glucuronidase